MIEGSILRGLPASVRASLLNSSDSEQEMFVEEYRRRKKSIGVGYILWILLGLHFGYLHKWGLQILFWITLGGALIWWLISLFTIPSMVTNYNKDVAVEVLRNQKIIMGAQPQP